VFPVRYELNLYILIRRNPSPLSCSCFVTRFFYGEKFLAPSTIPRLEDYALSALRVCLLNKFAANLRIPSLKS
jgi:hypothetical protein